MSKRRRCCSTTQYETANSVRRTPDGEFRFMSGDQCLNPAAFVDIDGDYWCCLHAKMTVNSCFAPFTRIVKPATPEATEDD